jgi:hypothetical protein
VSFSLLFGNVCYANLKIKPFVDFILSLQHLLIDEYEIFNAFDACIWDLNSFNLFILMSY